MKLNIVMEYAGGGDLSQRIKTAKEGKMHFSESQILSWFVQICLAVRYIHSKYVSLHSAKLYIVTSRLKMYFSLKKDLWNLGISELLELWSILRQKLGLL